MDFQFRSALNGFNRSDVVAFLQNMTEKHKAALLEAQAKASTAGEEIARMRTENEALRAQLAELKAKEEEPKEPSMQQKELEAYRRATEMEKRAAEKLQAATDKLEAAEAEAAEKVQAAETEAAEKLAAAEKEAAERAEKTRTALEQIRETVSGLTAFLSDAASSIDTI